jgi:hypothetical protein
LEHKGQSQIVLASLGLVQMKVTRHSVWLRLVSVVVEGPAQVLSEVGGGLPLAPLIFSCSPLTVVMDNSGFGLEFVDQRQEDKLEMVTCSTEEVKVGGYATEAFSVGKLVESFFRESERGRMEIGSTSKGAVGEEEGAMYQFSLDMQDYLPGPLVTV